MRTMAVLGIVGVLAFGSALAPASAQSDPYDPGYGEADGLGAPDGTVGPDGELLPDEGLDGAPGYGPPVVYDAPGLYGGQPVYRGPHFGEAPIAPGRGPDFVLPGRRVFSDGQRRLERDFGDDGRRGGARRDGRDGRQRQFGERRLGDGQSGGGRGGEQGGQRRRRNPDEGGDDNGR